MRDLSALRQHLGCLGHDVVGFEIDLEAQHRYEHRQDRKAGIEKHIHEDMDLTLPKGVEDA